MNVKHVIPAALHLVESGDPRAARLWEALPPDVAAAAAAVAAAGFRNAQGHITPEVHRLVAALNSHVSALAERMEGLPLEELAARHAAAVVRFRKAAAGGKRPPGLARMAENFGRAVLAEGRAVAAGVEPLTEEERRRRLAICLAPCRSLMGGPDGEAPRCAECGCYVHRKTSWRSQKCPRGKW